MSIDEPQFSLQLNPTSGEWEVVRDTLLDSTSDEPGAAASAAEAAEEFTFCAQPLPEIPRPRPTRDELAGEARVYLRDFIICCQFALDQEPNWNPAFDTSKRRPRPINRRRDIEWLISHSEYVLGRAANCNSDSSLLSLGELVNGIEQEIRDEIPKAGSLPNRNPVFAEVLIEMADFLRAWAKAGNSRSRLLLAAEFRLPDDQDFFTRADFHLWATKNELGGDRHNINKHLKPFLKDISLESGERVERETLILFLRYLRERRRAPRAP